MTPTPPVTLKPFTRVMDALMADLGQAGALLILSIHDAAPKGRFVQSRNCLRGLKSCVGTRDGMRGAIHKLIRRGLIKEDMIPSATGSPCRVHHLQLTGAGMRYLAETFQANR